MSGTSLNSLVRLRFTRTAKSHCSWSGIWTRAEKLLWKCRTSSRKALTKFVVKPLVTVTVQEVGSKRYYLDGYAARPGEYPLVVPTTILEAISKAGGVQDFANRKKIYVLRGDKRIPFNLNDVMKGKHMEQNILLQSGDHIVVP